MTEQVFNFITQTRHAFIQLINSLSVEELNHIPEGFNNNIIWNFGHIVVSTQTLSYVRTGIRVDASKVKFNEDYRKDTKPNRFVSIEEINELKELAISSILQIQQDYTNGVFNEIQAFTTATYKAELKTFEEVLITTAGHDNVHLGYALAQKKLINQ